MRGWFQMKKSIATGMTILSMVVTCGIVFMTNNSNVQADAIKTQQSEVVKSTALVTDNVIKVPDKTTVVAKNSNNGNRGTEFNGVKGSSGGNAVVTYAYTLIGTPYVWGAVGPKSFDCSGLAMYVYSKFGVSLPHYTGAQYSTGKAVNKNELAPGDLVFFNTYGSISHVGIYIGGGSFIHAPGTGSRVTISNLGEGYYQKAYAGARRYLK